MIFIVFKILNRNLISFIRARNISTVHVWMVGLGNLPRMRILVHYCTRLVYYVWDGHWVWGWVTGESIVVVMVFFCWRGIRVRLVSFAIGCFVGLGLVFVSKRLGRLGMAFLAVHLCVWSCIEDSVLFDRHTLFFFDLMCELAMTVFIKRNSLHFLNPFQITLLISKQVPYF